jgi:hypothetical protein
MGNLSLKQYWNKLGHQLLAEYLAPGLVKIISKLRSKG